MPGLLDIIAGLWLATSPMLGLAASPAATPFDPRPTGDDPSELLALSDDDLLRRIEVDPASLGSLSIGVPGRGMLFNGVQLETGPRWQIAPQAETWGTSETIAAVRAAIDTVHELFPDTPSLFIGDISDRAGGRLHRHQTHQAGRDADLGYYYKEGKGGWFVPGNAANLDLPRNWALVRALIVRTDVQAILLDARIQRLLYNYAVSIGEDVTWLAHIFQYPKGTADSLIRHVVGHQTHYHVRFFNPVAQELGRRVHPLLVQLKILDPPVYTAVHVVRPGQTIGGIAARYGTTVSAIMKANGLRSTLLRAGRAYRVPGRSAAPPDEPVVVPHRLLPPVTPPDMSGVDWPTPESLYGPAPSGTVPDLR
jgi:LysM repeat protein